jgi:hypothetical protein
MKVPLCSKCKVILTEENASPSVLKRGNGTCILCQSKYNKEKYDKNPEKYRTLSKNYGAEHREENKAYLKIYHKTYRFSARGKYERLKFAAKKFNRVLDISLEEYSLIIAGAICAYCSYDLSHSGGYSLDRVDHSKGYTIDNCVPCCRDCNSIKGMLESMGFSPTRAIELLQESNEIRNTNVIESIA